MRSEHANVPWEIEGELGKRFHVANARYFPLGVPAVSVNLLIGPAMLPRA